MVTLLFFWGGGGAQLDKIEALTFNFNTIFGIGGTFNYSLRYQRDNHSVNLFRIFSGIKFENSNSKFIFNH